MRHSLQNFFFTFYIRVNYTKNSAHIFFLDGFSHSDGRLSDITSTQIVRTVEICNKFGGDKIYEEDSLTLWTRNDVLEISYKKI